MAKQLFRKIFRNLGSGTKAAVPVPAADQPQLFDQPASVTTQAPQPVAEAAQSPERGMAERLKSALALRDAGRLDEAEASLVEIVEQFPTEPRPQIELAAISHFRRDWTEAAQRWEIVRGEFPDEPLAYTLAAAALREAGRLDEAERLATTAHERF